MGKEPKNHHYVPQVLLREFCFKKNAVWYHFRESGKKKPIKRNIAGIFSKKHYYTIEEEGQRSAKVETEFYQKVDNLLAEILNETSRAFEEGSIPIFSNDSLISVKHIFSIFAKRTPDFVKDLEPKTLLNFETKLGVSNKEDVKKAYSKKSDPERKQLVKNARIRAQAGSSKLLMDALDGLQAVWAIPEEGKQFVIGSYPVLRLEDIPNTRLGSEYVELWLPVSPRRMLGLVHSKKCPTPKIWEVPREKVRELNKYTFKQSSEIASESEKLLASLIRQRS